MKNEKMNKPGATGIQRILKATFFSFKGLCAAWKNEAAFRQELMMCAVLIPLAFFIGKGAVQVSLLIGPCLIVLITELFNSAIESIVDRIGSEHHTLSGRAKDIGSAAVFVSLVLLAVIWGLIFFENFMV